MIWEMGELNALAVVHEHCCFARQVYKVNSWSLLVANGRSFDLCALSY
jgi:hypothetical protein